MINIWRDRPFCAALVVDGVGVESKTTVGPGREGFEQFYLADCRLLLWPAGKWLVFEWAWPGVTCCSGLLWISTARKMTERTTSLITEGCLPPSILLSQCLVHLFISIHFFPVFCKTQMQMSVFLYLTTRDFYLFFCLLFKWSFIAACRDAGSPLGVLAF